MGQHKYNPTAILAKEGNLPPKPVRKPKREVDRMLMQAVQKATGVDQLYRVMGIENAY